MNAPGAAARRPGDVLVRVTGPDLNLEFLAGDTVIAFGREASGTSELLRAMVGQQRIPGCRLEVLGVDPVAASPPQLVALRRRIGFIFRATGLLSNLTIEENVALPIRYHASLPRPAIAARVQSLVEALGLGSVRRRRPDDVDLLTRKRAALARALTLDPDILLADYPLEGIDPVGAARFLEVMREVSARPGRLFVVATCELDPYAAFGGRFLMFDRGEVIWKGDREELESATHPAVQQFRNRSVRGPLTTF